MKPLAIDLFCGAGGMSEGILQAGFHIVFSSDINSDVMKTYTNRHQQLGYIQGKNTIFECIDIRELKSNYLLNAISQLEMFKHNNDPIEIDAIFGGPPCQGFSRAGKRMTDDPRNLLFKEYLRIINEVRPKYVIMENVEGFNDTKLENFVGVTGRKYEGNHLVPDLLRREFIEIGYNTLEPRILDASDFGVPQKRKRVIFIAYRENVTVPSYPEPIYNNTNKVTINDALSDLYEPNINLNELTKYQLESRLGRTRTITNEQINYNGIIMNHEKSAHSNLIKERFSLYLPGENTVNLKKRILNYGIDLSNCPLLVEECRIKLDNLYTTTEIIYHFQNNSFTDEMLKILLTKKGNRLRLNPNELAPTVVTLPDDYLTPYENRIPSVRELARLQSFDDSFQFLGKRTTGGSRRKFDVPQYTQVGNAVPPLLARAIAKEIINALKNRAE